VFWLVCIVQSSVLRSCESCVLVKVLWVCGQCGSLVSEGINVISWTEFLSEALITMEPLEFPSGIDYTLDKPRDIMYFAQFNGGYWIAVWQWVAKSCATIATICTTYLGSLPFSALCIIVYACGSSHLYRNSGCYRSGDKRLRVAKHQSFPQ
jgi:hypothetical protein